MVAIAAPLTPRFNVKINIGSSMMFVIAPKTLQIIAPLLFPILIKKLANAIWQSANGVPNTYIKK